MSSSSSDSDSDEFEPIRKIKINIRPKDEAIKKNGADVNEIKASIEAWRPLGPPVHPSLSRRQSSMSSVSSLSFGVPSTYGGSGSNTSSYTATAPNSANIQDATPTPTIRPSMRSSPSCSSLVNEFTNRSSFSNFMSNSSRTSSPLNAMNQFGDTVPIAIAIQESIEVTVVGQRGPDIGVTKFNTRALGNIKVAFPNAFAQRCNNGGVPVGPVLKLRIHSTENIVRYYASKFIRDLNLDNNNTPMSSASSTTKSSLETDATADDSGRSNNTDNNNLDNNLSERFSDFFDLNESPVKGSSNFKIIEFDMEALVSHLKQLYLQTPTSRYFNVDVLRYQIAPIQEFEKCPLQVCAYWKCEPKLTKVRIDFKHSNKCGFNLERLRDIKFCIDMANFIPHDIQISSLSPDSISTLKLNNNNNNDSVATNMNSNNTSRYATMSGGGNNFDALLETIRSMNSPSIDSSSITNSSIQQPLKLTPSSLITHQNQNLNNQQNTHPTPAVRRNLPAGGNLISSLVGDKNEVQSTRHKPGSQDFQIKLPPPPSRSNHGTLNRAFTQAAISRQQPTTSRPPSSPLVVKLPPATPLNSSHSSQSSLLNATNNLSNGGQQQLQSNNQLKSALVDQSDCTLTTSLLEDNGNFGTLSSSAGQFVAHANAQTPSPPFVTYEPPAHWNSSAKQLTWKFDNLLPYYKTDGSGSLLAKLDFRNEPKLAAPLISDELFSKLDPSVEPKPIDVKFMIVDSTLSKISISIDTIGYRISLLKKEIRSGRYQSEPYIF